jgi:uncharacterized protein (UPF0305 family)
MIDRKLETLGKYAEKIENEEPLRLLIDYFNQKENEIKKSSSEYPNIEKEFIDNIENIVNKYKNKGLTDVIILSHIFNIFIRTIKGSMIEYKANELGINKTLYKKEMRILFKGKWK